MTIQEIAGCLQARVLEGDHLDTRLVESACGSDLMSDVLAFVKENTVLITGLINPHVLRTAEMLDIVCIVFSRGKLPTQEMLDMAREMGIAVLATTHTTYTACGVLYAQGLRGGRAKEREEP